MELVHNTRVTLEMIKWEHSIFALPFALCGAMLAAGGLPGVHQLGWIVVAMVAARSAAMAFNRLVDHEIDAANPRTKMRALPAGLLTRGFVLGFTLVCCGLFFLAAARLNRLALVLAPVALAVLLSYSFTKRFTRWSHLVLGLSLGIAPSAAWIAVRGTLDVRIIVLTLAVIFWVAGFDVLYACQDFEFDCGAGLHSVPRHIGVSKSLWVARLFHVITLGLLAWVAVLFGLGVYAWVGVAVVGLLLFYEHTLVKANDLSKLNAAFFTMNGVISVLFFVAVAADLLVRRR
jgi:4-hydroxybenzoate polyprenyltransferase